MIGPGIVALVLIITGLLLAQVRTRRGPVVPSHAPDLQPEIERARRYGHEFTLVRLPLGDRRDLSEVGPHLRSTDRAWIDGRDLYVFVPELEGAAVERFIRRLADGVAIPQPDEVATATFPTDGLTLPALFAQLHQATRRAPHSVATPGTPTTVSRRAS